MVPPLFVMGATSSAPGPWHHSGSTAAPTPGSTCTGLGNSGTSMGNDYSGTEVNASTANKVECTILVDINSNSATRSRGGPKKEDAALREATPRDGLARRGLGGEAYHVGLRVVFPRRDGYQPLSNENTMTQREVYPGETYPLNDIKSATMGDIDA